jgi:glycosyltransferase involved in cell wall biosynthesis
MKILVAHNHYQQNGGEDTVARSEFNLLKDFGHDVRLYERDNREIKNSSFFEKLRFLFDIKWSRRSYNDMRKALQEFRPDVVHFHNIFFVLTPSVYSACRDEGIPVVQSLHNFRPVCLNGLFLRNGKVCELCAQRKSFWKGVLYRCYRKSWLISVVLSDMLNHHWVKKTWTNMINVYITATEFSRQKYIKFGIPNDQIMHKPNIVYPNLFNQKQDGGYALYVGRLSKEKGVEGLLNAWKHIQGFQLKIMGDGPLSDDLRSYVDSEKIANVEFLGFVSSKEYLRYMQGASFLVIPSVCYENFPCIVSEAFACGIPILASNFGGMSEIIKDRETGFLFRVGDVDDLVEKIKLAISSKDTLRKMRENVLKEYEAKYTPEENHKTLLTVYSRAMRYRLTGKV